MKRMSRSKTLWFSLALVVFGALMENLQYLQNVIDPQYYGGIMIFVGVVVATLRFITTQPLDK
jgi:hypothetical protein